MVVTYVIKKFQNFYENRRLVLLTNPRSRLTDPADTGNTFLLKAGKYLPVDIMVAPQKT